MDNCKEASTPAAATVPLIEDMEDAVDEERHSLFRRSVGKLQWEVPLREDIAFTVKEFGSMP